MSVVPPPQARPLLAFDLMDTVVVDPFYRDVPRTFGLKLEQLFAGRDPAAWPAFERNQISEQTFMKRFYQGEVPDGSPTVQQVWAVIQRNYRFVDQMPSLLERLGAEGLELWVFSNYPVWFEVVRQRLRLERYFHGFVVSYRTGARKPEPAAYQAFCREVGRPARSCLLVDDREVNVAGAQSAGMPAVLFRGVDQLTHDLAARGIGPI